MSDPTATEATRATIASPVSRIPDADAYFAEVFDKYSEHVNPYLANFGSPDRSVGG